MICVDISVHRCLSANRLGKIFEFFNSTEICGTLNGKILNGRILAHDRKKITNVVSGASVLAFS